MLRLGKHEITLGSLTHVDEIISGTPEGGTTYKTSNYEVEFVSGVMYQVNNSSVNNSAVNKGDSYVAVDTGDDSSMMLYMILLMGATICGGILAVQLVEKRRRRVNKQE